MVLNCENIFSYIFQTFVGSIIHIGKCRHSNLWVKTLRIDRITMVLRRDINSSSLHIFHRVIAAAVSIFQFKSICTCSKCHELMSQTDCKDRDLCLIELADLFDHLHTGLRISRAVG